MVNVIHSVSSFCPVSEDEDRLGKKKGLGKKQDKKEKKDKGYKMFEEEDSEEELVSEDTRWVNRMFVTDVWGRRLWGGAGQWGHQVSQQDICDWCLRKKTLRRSWSARTPGESTGCLWLMFEEEDSEEELVSEDTRWVNRMFVTDVWGRRLWGGAGQWGHQVSQQDICDWCLRKKTLRRSWSVRTPGESTGYLWLMFEEEDWGGAGQWGHQVSQQDICDWCLRKKTLRRSWSVRTPGESTGCLWLMLQDCSISSPLAMEILQSCTKPQIWGSCWSAHSNQWAVGLVSTKIWQLAWKTII